MGCVCERQGKEKKDASYRAAKDNVAATEDDGGRKSILS